MKYSANSVWENKDEYDIAVIGAGHAGCEAALAAARMGFKTVVFTVSVESIAMMPCNPNIGGSSKGHLVKEVDALGGEMGKVIDKTFIQSKMLNQSKGPAVHSLRAQADKEQYSRTMRRVLENQENLDVRQTEVVNILTEEVCESGKKKVIGVQILSGGIYRVKAVVLCTGTYLRARCVYGEVSNATGPNGLQAANHLTECLKNLGINMYRFKTGTPARIDKRSIDFSKMEAQYGDERITPFSFTTNPDDIQIDQVPCWLTYTNEKTHEIIRNNLDRSPLYSGMIEGTGPRYCPSIEDKVVRFADKNRHQVFIEPEGIDTNEMYIGGMSSSLPEDVQYDMYRSVAGLEYAKIVRNAYAIEYDCIDARQLKPSLEFREIEGLFSGGQFNGSSGYEEAAAHYDKISDRFRRCGITQYEEFTNILFTWKEEILNSFLRPYNDRKLSNAYTENINSQLRTYLSVSRGISNFSRFRKRVIYALSPDIRYALTSTLSDCRQNRRKRGSYHKVKD